MTQKKDIINAWAIMREQNNTIPDEVLDFMKYSALEKLQAGNENGEPDFKKVVSKAVLKWLEEFEIIHGELTKVTRIHKSCVGVGFKNESSYKISINKAIQAEMDGEPDVKSNWPKIGDKVCIEFTDGYQSTGEAQVGIVTYISDPNEYPEIALNGKFVDLISEGHSSRIHILQIGGSSEYTGFWGRSCARLREKLAKQEEISKGLFEALCVAEKSLGTYDPIVVKQIRQAKISYVNWLSENDVAQQRMREAE